MRMAPGVRPQAAIPQQFHLILPLALKHLKVNVASEPPPVIFLVLFFHTADLIS